MGKLYHNGRSKERVVILKFSWIESEAWRCLPPPACKLFIELRRRFNGRNNGDISLSYREAAEVAGCSKSSAMRHMAKLIAHGFIELHTKGLMRNRHATTWYLTMERCDYHASYPTNKWREFKCL